MVFTDQLVRGDESTAMRNRSLVGLMPLIAFALFHEEDLLAGSWFLSALEMV